MPPRSGVFRPLQLKKDLSPVHHHRLPRPRGWRFSGVGRGCPFMISATAGCINPISARTSRRHSTNPVPSNLGRVLMSWATDGSPMMFIHVPARVVLIVCDIPSTPFLSNCFVVSWSADRSCSASDNHRTRLITCWNVAPVIMMYRVDAQKWHSGCYAHSC